MRLIDADALKERAIRVSTVKEHCYMKAVGTKEIDRAPTIDAVPVVHGRWGEYEIHPLASSLNGYPCTVCDQREQRKTNFCPNCGAKMDGEE